MRQELLLLMAEALHHLGCINPANNEINYLSSGRISAINSSIKEIPSPKRTFSQLKIGRKPKGKAFFSGEKSVFFLCL